MALDGVLVSMMAKEPRLCERHRCASSNRFPVLAPNSISYVFMNLLAIKTASLLTPDGDLSATVSSTSAFPYALKPSSLIHLQLSLSPSIPMLTARTADLKAGSVRNKLCEDLAHSLEAHLSWHLGKKKSQ
jgi:hypothetical protein